MYFSGQGKLFYAVRDVNGLPGPYIFAGNVPSLKVTLTTETSDHQESTSGQRLVDFRLTKSKKAEVSFTLEDWSLVNLAMGMYGQVLPPNTGSTVTSESLGMPDAGQYTPLKHANVSTVVIGTKTAGTDYILNAATGMIQWLTKQSAAVSASYAWAANAGSVTMFTQNAPERWFRFEGLNTADLNRPVLVELYRTVIDPMKELDLITDDLLKMELTGTALYDAQRGIDPSMGNFGRVQFLA